MSHSDTKCDGAPDLLSLMTASDGRVLPHADCSRLTVALPEERETGGGGGDDKDLAERRRTRRKRCPAPTFRPSCRHEIPYGLMSVREFLHGRSNGASHVWREASSEPAMAR